jgi:uncharacterized protein YcbX
MLELTEINIYPIKSTRRISLGESTVLKRGLAWDRRWMLVDSDGNFITARKYPRLATVSTQLTTDTLNVRVRGMPELCIPLEPPQEGETRKVTVWRDTCTAIEYGLDYDQWFSEFLGLRCHLVRMRSSDVRAVSADYGMEGDEVSFADSFPLLLISEASLADLNNRLDNPVSMRRFRPNIVVSGCDAFDEDHWRRLRIGNVEFEGARACSRCVFTTIDPDTGEKDADREPLRTLGTYRKRKEGGIFFGQNLIPRGAGTIHVGDPVTIETRTGQAG